MAFNLNNVTLGGTVIEEPQFTGTGEDAWAFFKLVTSHGLKLPDGSYTNVEQIAQIVADVPHHVKTTREYIKKGKAIVINGYYRTWQVSGQIHHGFFIRTITFASANWNGGN